MSSFPRWQLHRGYWKKGFRENTLEAFELAKEYKCKMVEMDVQLSRDGVPHIYHDYKLDRFFHINDRLDQQSSEDLKALNIPTLEEVLLSDKVPEFLNIEIKTIDLLCLKISKKICSLLQDVEHQKKILISSFNPMALFWVAKYLPDTPRALIIGDEKLLLSWTFKISMKLARPSYINARGRLIDNDKTRELLLSFKKPLMIWTINDQEKAMFYLDRGAVSIISDVLPLS